MIIRDKDSLEFWISISQVIESVIISYDFVFIAKDTIAVSKVRVRDQYFGVTISEFYFISSKDDY